MKFSGVGVALVTPFTKRNKIDFDVLKQLIDFQVREKTDYLVILGSTAEAATISDKERKQIIEFSISYANKRIPIVIGTGSNDTKKAIKYTKEAEKLGANGVLVVTPYYNRPTQDGLFEHYKKIAKSTTLPVILYNVPSRTGVNLEPKTVYKLSKIDNIVALKEASGSLQQAKEIIDLCGDNLTLLSGNDDQLYDFLALGGKGIISVTANIIPGRISALINRFNEDLDARNEFNNLNELHEAMFIETNPIPVKSALIQMGYEVGRPRLPLTKLTKKNEVKLIEVLKKYEVIK